VTAFDIVTYERRVLLERVLRQADKSWWGFGLIKSSRLERGTVALSHRHRQEGDTYSEARFHHVIICIDYQNWN
jgi:hypothetical protein